MALNVSAWSIRQPLPSIVLSIVLLILGWMSFKALPITRLPNADIPVVSVVVAQFGAAPAELEVQVTKLIEDGVSGVEGARHISSTITDGLSVTTIQFRLEVNTDRALNDVKDAVTRVRGRLPQNINEPLIQRVDVVGLPIVTYAAVSPGSTPEQLSCYRRRRGQARAARRARRIQVERIGGVDREILVVARSGSRAGGRPDRRQCQRNPARHQRRSRGRPRGNRRRAIRPSGRSPAPGRSTSWPAPPSACRPAARFGSTTSAA